MLQRKIKYLGHILSADGIQTDDSKIEKIRSWPKITSRKELHRFLGLAGYYRRFIKDFSKIAHPLQMLLRGEPTKVKKKGKASKMTYPTFVWGDEQQQAFDQLVSALTSTPVLAFADFEKPFILQTDASSVGLGSVLSQEHDGQLKPIAYASRGLTASERNYPAHKLEFLAMKWSICEKFNDYLYGAKFQVLTDNNPLTYVMKSAKLDATTMRWVADLSCYNFSIRYRSGKQNQAADALSRMYEVIPDETVKAICSAEPGPLVTCLSMSETVVPDSIMIDGTVLVDDWSTEQRKDKSIAEVLKTLEEGKDLKTEDREAVMLWRQRRRLNLVNDVLYRVFKTNDKFFKQLVLPQQFRKDVLHSLHNEMGHLGRERLLQLVRNRFFWVGMQKDVDDHVSRCENCMKRKHPVPRAELVNISTSRPLELVCMDFLCLETSVGIT